MSTLLTTIHHSPVGPLRLLASERGLRGLYFTQHRHAPSTDPAWVVNDSAFEVVREQLDGYFDGTRTRFELPLDPIGTPWQRKLWTALESIPYGETRSYGALASAVCSPSAARAVGLANGRNPISIIVPCHRVIGADGGLTGYGGGLARKRFLLELEQRVTAEVPVAIQAA